MLLEVFCPQHMRSFRLSIKKRSKITTAHEELSFDYQHEIEDQRRYCWKHLCPTVYDKLSCDFEKGRRALQMPLEACAHNIWKALFRAPKHCFDSREQFQDYCICRWKPLPTGYDELSWPCHPLEFMTLLLGARGTWGDTYELLFCFLPFPFPPLSAFLFGAALES
jgi:hypothetical protein